MCLSLCYNSGKITDIKWKRCHMHNASVNMISWNKYFFPMPNCPVQKYNLQFKASNWKRLKLKLILASLWVWEARLSFMPQLVSFWGLGNKTIFGGKECNQIVARLDRGWFDEVRWGERWIFKSLFGLFGVLKITYDDPHTVFWQIIKPTKYNFENLLEGSYG